LRCRRDSEQGDRLVLGGCCDVSANGITVQGNRRLGEDGPDECRILVSRQRGGDPHNRPRGNARDVGECSREVLAGHALERAHEC